jgi:hypothetical protein
MRDVKKGDIILHGFKQQVVAVSVAKNDCYSASRPDEITDDWHNDGWKVDLDYYCFENPIKPKDIWEELRPIQPSKYAPVDRNGNGNEGYLLAANLNICQCILNNIAKNGAPGVNATSTHTFEKASKVVNKSLQIKISEYDKVVRDGEPELILKANKFINDYNYQKLKSITKEQYVIGTGKTNTFCYRVTYELDGLGSIRSGTPNKYGFYYSAYGDDREMKYRTNKVFGDTNSDGATEDAFNNVKRAIFDLLVAGNHNDYKAIEDNPLSTIFKGKLLCIYYPDQYLNVYSEEHAKYYMSKLGIEVDESKGIMEWLQQMITWKNEDPVAKNWTNHEFSKFLYHGIGYPPDSEKQKSALRIYEKKVDNELIDAIEDTPESDLPQKEDYVPTPEDRKDPIVIGENYSYPRNKVIALKALKRANYDCEIDNGHPSFMRKTNGTKYTEPHHLVPMSEQDRYENSLDVQANIISLCSNCHNELHYGQNPEPLLRKLYTNRKEELEAAGISISFEDLIKLYI